MNCLCLCTGLCHFLQENAVQTARFKNLVPPCRKPFIKFLVLDNQVKQFDGEGGKRRAKVVQPLHI